MKYSMVTSVTWTWEKLCQLVRREKLLRDFTLPFVVLYWISTLYFIDSGSIDTAIDMGRVTESILCGSFRLVNSLPTATCTIFPTRLGRFVFSYWWKFSGSITLVRWKHYTHTSIHLFQATSATYHELFLLTYLHEIALLV